MIGKILDMLTGSEASPDASGDDGRQLASAALLVEVAKADASFSSDERRALLELLRSTFTLDEEALLALESLAAQRSDEAVSLHEFTRQIVQNSGPEERCHLIGLMWQVAYADGRLDKYEEHLIRRVADLIYVSHSDMMRLKHQFRTSG